MPIEFGSHCHHVMVHALCTTSCVIKYNNWPCSVPLCFPKEMVALTLLFCNSLEDCMHVGSGRTGYVVVCLKGIEGDPVS